MECESCPAILAKTQSCPVVGDSALVYPMVALSVFPYLLSFTVLGLYLVSPSPILRKTFKAGLWTFCVGLLLKEIIQQDRPNGACSRSYGMPSNHSALMSCFVTVQIMTLKGGWKHCIGLLWLLVGVICSRIYLNYHTPLQCAAGTVVGVAVAVLCSFEKTKSE